MAITFEQFKSIVTEDMGDFLTVEDWMFRNFQEEIGCDGYQFQHPNGFGYAFNQSNDGKWFYSANRGTDGRGLTLEAAKLDEECTYLLLYNCLLVSLSNH